MRLLGRAVLGLFIASLLLALAEGAARVLGAGAMVPFFLPRQDRLGRTWMLTNPAVGDNWFRSAEWEDQVRMPRSEVFLREKPPGTYRIFVLGESSAWGTPLEDNASWASQLEGLLAEGQDAREVEVINLAVRAVTASVYLDVLPELLAQDPDLVVLYAGHNEVYGVRRAAFPRSLRLWRAAEDALQGEPVAIEAAPRIGLRAGDRTPAGGEAERTAARRFAEDLDRLVDGLDGVPLLAYVVHGSERDLAPLCSAGDGADPAAQAEADTLLRGAAVAPIAAMDEDCAPEALNAVPGHAGLRFVAGWCAHNEGDSEAAVRAFREAEDLDCVPVRARSSILEALRGLPGRHPGAPVRVVDPAPLLRAASPGGALGHEVFYDHVHLTVLGSYLVARAGALALAREPALFGLPLREADIPSYEALRAAQRIEPVDDWLALQRMEVFVDHSVIREVSSAAWSKALYQSGRTAIWPALDPLEQALLRGPLGDGSTLHLELARRRREAGDAAGALRETWSAAAARPCEASVQAELAQRLAEAGEREAARSAAERASLLGFTGDAIRPILEP